MAAPNQIILAIDTATSGTQVALSNKDQTFSRTDDRPHAQAECLVPLIDEVMKESGRSFDNINTILCVAGPGSFTGLRTGLATAKAIAQSTGRPLNGISAFDAFALQYQGSKPFCVIIESRRAEFFCQLYDETEQDPALVSAENLQDYTKGDIILIGNGLIRYYEEIGKDMPDQKHIHLDIKLLAENFDETNDMFTKDPSPIYLRGADISQPKHKPRQIA